MAKDFWGSLGQLFYNSDVDTANQAAQDANTNYNNLIQQYQGKDMSLGHLMKQSGLMNEDGTINSSRFFDQQTFNNQKAQTQEGLQNSLANARAEASRRSMVGGAAGSGAASDLSSVLNLANSQNNAARAAARSLGQTESQMRNAARSQALNMGHQEQTDETNAMNRELQLAQTRAQNANNYASQQQRGLFQDPKALLSVAEIAAGALIPGAQGLIAGGVSGLLNGGGQQQAAQVPGFTYNPSSGEYDQNKGPSGMNDWGSGAANAAQNDMNEYDQQQSPRGGSADAYWLRQQGYGR